MVHGSLKEKFIVHSSWCVEEDEFMARDLLFMEGNEFIVHGRKGHG